MAGEIIMLYPIFTYDDGTEVTASKPDQNGDISLYIEKFDTKEDQFINATIVIPNARILSSSGYSEEELNMMLEEYSQLQDDIIGYVMEKVNAVSA